MIDLILIVILIIFATFGYKRGLIRSVITLCSSIAALVLSFVVYPALNMFLKLTPLYTSVYEGVFKKIEAINFGKGIQSQGEAILENITWLPQFLTLQIKNNNNTAMYELLGVKTIQEYISIYIANMIISLIAILITWFLLKIVLVVVLRALGSIIEHLPVISSFNRGGGLIFGLVKGVLTLSVIGLIIPVFITLPAFQDISQSIEATILTKWMYDNNFILLIYNYLI